MTISIAAESPLSEDAHALIEGSEAALREVYSVDECFTFTAAELDEPSVTFFVARSDGVALGCVALVDCGAYGEVKRLFVRTEARGKALAVRLMAALEAQALAKGMQEMKLETGDKLVAAVSLYRRLGYRECGPFGAYELHPASLFMEKEL
ncbi:GNAT family N-acetyltransferase [Aliiroseovarius marinus]|uniref:GNAT family N-acetyltransferase n=1 Tax=Aliiroseovarius marinus TaxID=2500159 RepID=UPI003D7EE1A3